MDNDNQKGVASQQMGLFGDVPVEPHQKLRKARRRDGAVLAAPNEHLRAVATRLPSALRLGTSSWSFPGWQGLVWADDCSKTRLSRDGLAAYAQHPLFDCVGLDRTFYSPMTVASYADCARLVPAGFRFFVKAWQNITSTSLRAGPGRWLDNPDFLDTRIAREKIIGPTLDGLGEKLGAFIFQFPPLGPAITRNSEAFASRLHRFLSALPQGPDYTFELRDRELYDRCVVDAIADAGGHLCLTVHPRAVDIEQQYQLACRAGTGPLLVRWNLGHGLRYADAKATYSPFDKIQAEDMDTRMAVARIAHLTIANDHPVSVIINNKAEGSAPLSVVELARTIANGSAPSS